MSNKFNFKGNSIYDRDESPIIGRVFYWATVESNDDDFDGGRIKARIKKVDDGKTLKELPYAFPLIQKFMHSVPKVGETVMVFMPDVSNPNVDRMFVGPLISQPQFLPKDPELYTSKSLVDTGYRKPESAPSTIPDSIGVYPTKDEIAIQGRNNSDIIFRDNQLVLRAGKFEVIGNNENNKIPKFNKKNPAYIQIVSDTIIKKGEGSNQPDTKGTVTNIVANKINLLTHDDGQPRFNLNDQKTQITEDEMLTILEKAHPLVFGDILVEYLKLQRAAFSNHVHRYHGTKAEDLSGANDIDKYLEFDLNRLLSKNVRTN